MARNCPENDSQVLYLTCQECDSRFCEMSAIMQRYYLYEYYLDELASIRGKEWEDTEEERKEWCTSYMRDTDYVWIDIKSHNSVIGFLLVGTGKDCHPDCNYFIAESFILPAYRKRGFMSSAVQSFVLEHPGKYCMLIIKKNDYAKEFWNRLFSKIGYESFDLRNVVKLRCDIEQYGFNVCNNPEM